MRLFAAVLMFFSLAGAIQAQSAGKQSGRAISAAGQDASIFGTVTEYTGLGIPNVEIVAIASDGQAYRTTSNFEGRFDLAVPVGQYRIEFTANEYSSLHLTNVSVPINVQKPITAVLEQVICDLPYVGELDPIPVEEPSVSSQIFVQSGRQEAPSRARLTGTVYDPTGSVIPGATVTAVDGENRIFRSKTNGSGVYELELPFVLYDPSSKSFDVSNFRLAKYDISAEAPNFVKSRVPGFKISPSFRQQMQLDFALDIIGPDPCHDPTACSPADAVEIRTPTPSSDIYPRKSLLPN